MNENTKVTIGIIATALLIFGLFGLADGVAKEDRPADGAQLIMSSLLILGSATQYILISAVESKKY